MALEGLGSGERMITAIGLAHYYTARPALEQGQQGFQEIGTGGNARLVARKGEIGFNEYPRVPVNIFVPTDEPQAGLKRRSQVAGFVNVSAVFNTLFKTKGRSPPKRAQAKA